MASLDYFNPNSINPGTSYKPSGFLGGMTWMEDRNRYRQLAELQDYLYGLEAQKKTGEYEDYRLDAPVREAERPAKIARFGEEAQNALPRGNATLAQLLEQIDEVELRNKKTRGTIESDIESTNAVNRGKGSKANLDQFAQDTEYLDNLIGTIDPDAPQPAQDAQWGQVLQQIPAEYRRYFPKTWGKPAKDQMQRLREMTMRGTYAQTRAMDQERMKQLVEQQGRMDVVGAQGQTQENVANIRAQAKNRSVMQALNDPNFLRNPEQAWVVIQTILADSDIDPQLKAKATELARRIEPLVRGRLRPGQPTFPGLPSGERPEIDPDQRVPSPGTSESIIDLDALKRK